MCEKLTCTRARETVNDPNTITEADRAGVKEEEREEVRAGIVRCDPLLHWPGGKLQVNQTGGLFRRAQFPPSRYRDRLKKG